MNVVKETLQPLYGDTGLFLLLLCTRMERISDLLAISSSGTVTMIEGIYGHQKVPQVMYFGDVKEK